MGEPTGGSLRQGSVERVAVAVDFDPAVWLAGPTGGDAASWTAAALAAVCADLAVAQGGPEERALHDVLHAFATAHLGCDFRFLRLPDLVQPPVVAMLHIWTADPSRADPSEQGDAVLTSYEPGTRWYDAEPELSVVDEGSDLRRSVRYAMDDDGRLSSVIRYHRRVAELATDVVLACAGADLRTTALALADLDDLACAVRLVDRQGVRR